MQVYEGRVDSAVVTIDASGTPDQGYAICRRVEGPDGKSETFWRLSSAQSQLLRHALASVVVSDSLEPSLAAYPHFDWLLVDALAAMSPALRPLTFWNRDAQGP